MNGAVLLVLGVVLFALAYRFYGRYLQRLFRVEPDRSTPAHTQTDGVDYVPTRLPVLFGHHFASIAGAGPIVGPVAAVYFGWLPVALWILLGCIFVGAVHDFGALYLSVRHEGRSIGQVVESQIGYMARQIFLLFCWATLVLVVAVFAVLVAGTFVATPSAATSSLLFVLMAPIFGWLVYRKGLGLVAASMIFVPLLFVFVWLGVEYPLDLVRVFGLSSAAATNVWLAVLCVYVFIASVIPVWVLLQPRDYLNSYLLYGMILLGFIGVMVARPGLEAPAFTGLKVVQGGRSLGLFPILFVTVACGACSGFHALVASGTTSKQLRSERDILPIGYGSMLVEGVLALMALVSVAYLAGSEGAAVIAARKPVGAFAAGLAHFTESIGLQPDIAETFFTLAISAFLLTTLDTATRLTRFTWQELLIPRADNRSRSAPMRRFFGNRFVATVLVLAAVAVLCLMKYTDAQANVIPVWKIIWPVFGASNQLLAALTLLAVSLALARRKANAWITSIPMLFMLVICIWALIRLLLLNMGKSVPLTTATAFLLVLALILVFQSAVSLIKQRKQEVA